MKSEAGRSLRGPVRVDEGLARCREFLFAEFAAVATIYGQRERLAVRAHPTCAIQSSQGLAISTILFEGVGVDEEFTGPVEILVSAVRAIYRE